MTKTTILDSQTRFLKEFHRCCGTYRTLDIAVAWLGNPSKGEPFRSLRDIAPETRVVAGVAFFHTHPEGIQWFIDNDADIRIFEDGAEVFHPKIYLFQKPKGFALFIGSSNFTNSGFTKNQETNCLIEGTYTKAPPGNLLAARGLIESWRQDAVSFVPTDEWLRRYSAKYRSVANRHRKQRTPAPHITDEKTSGASWIEVADWSIYYREVSVRLANLGGGEEHHHILNLASEKIPTPWRRRYFNDAENRRIIGGYRPYGWFGHVGANGDFRRILANGTEAEQTTIVQSINAAAGLQSPVRWNLLERRLNSLVALGPSMNVWSRLLCLVRPDLYCTIASKSVRRNLSAVFHIPQRRIVQVDGYMELLAAIHACPWFNSSRPNNTTEALAWERRVALLDAVFYERGGVQRD